MTVVDPDKTRKIRLGEAFDTRQFLSNAADQAAERHFDDYLIVDVDCHHYEFDHWPEIIRHIDDPIFKHLADSMPSPAALLSSPPMYQEMGDRIGRRLYRRKETTTPQRHREVEVTLRYMDSLGIDYTILFPSPMLMLAFNPQIRVEAEMSRAYNRWLVENVLAREPRIMSMLYLPFNDPEASIAMVEEFGDAPGVRGFMVTAVHLKPVHDNAYTRLYAMLEERGIPLAFHSSYSWEAEQSTRQMNKFLSVHALTFPYYTMVHLTNWVINGLPELFPKLRVSWIEGGLAWVPFIMMRLDHEYMMRSSEAPALKKKPSEYIRDMFFTSQPMEIPENMGFLEQMFDMIGAESQLMYSSDYPHWDFEVPSRLFDLPFLTEVQRRNILGLNACRFFGMDPAVLPLAKPKAA